MNQWLLLLDSLIVSFISRTLDSFDHFLLLPILVLPDNCCWDGIIPTRFVTKDVRLWERRSTERSKTCLEEKRELRCLPFSVSFRNTSETETEESFSRNLSNSCFQVQEKVKSFCFCQGFLFKWRRKSREIRKKKKREEEENSFAWTETNNLCNRLCIHSCPVSSPFSSTASAELYVSVLYVVIFLLFRSIRHFVEKEERSHSSLVLKEQLETPRSLSQEPTWMLEQDLYFVSPFFSLFREEGKWVLCLLWLTTGSEGKGRRIKKVTRYLPLCHCKSKEQTDCSNRSLFLELTGQRNEWLILFMSSQWTSLFSLFIGVQLQHFK